MRHDGTWYHVLRLDADRPYLQIHCKDSPEGPWSGRKWFISYHMTTSEVCRTLFKAYLAAEQHEVEEAYRYKGKAVFGPHFDVERLVELIDTDELPVDVRPNGMLGI